MLAVALAWPAAAEKLNGIRFPSQETAGHTELLLNGAGLRTYSIFHVHIYVAGLYLQTPSHSAKDILASSGKKMLVLHFVRNVPAAKVRKAWRTGLLNNCVAPCTLSPEHVAQFLASLHAVRAGDTAAFVFTKNGLHVYYDGKLAGVINDPHFATQMLAVFIGPHPGAPGLKAALLGVGGNAG